MKSRTILVAVVAALTIATTATAGNTSLAAIGRRMSKVEHRLNIATRLLLLHDDRIKALEDRSIQVAPVQAFAATNQNGSASGNVQCPAGQIATGGGASFQSAQAGDHIVFSDPTITNGQASGWQAAAVKTDGGQGTLIIEAICMTAP